MKIDDTETTRFGDWTFTFSGKVMWPLDPEPDDIDIIDIAHSLSMQCRYGGHVRDFYSVAEHSLYISHAVAPECALWGLLHDAAEAYITDIPAPIKPYILGYNLYEDDLLRVIARHFELRFPIPSQVKEMDTRILHNEKAALITPHPREWSIVGDPLPHCQIACFSPQEAEHLFLQRFYALTVKAAA